MPRWGRSASLLSTHPRSHWKAAAPTTTPSTPTSKVSWLLLHPSATRWWHKSYPCWKRRNSRVRRFPTVQRKAWFGRRKVCYPTWKLTLAVCDIELLFVESQIDWGANSLAPLFLLARPGTRELRNVVAHDRRITPQRKCSGSGFGWGLGSPPLSS